MTREELKVEGEDAAQRFLEARGLKVLARNWRLKMGELDIVAMDGPTIVFVEVKTRKTASFMEPSGAVNWKKQQKLRRLAEAFMKFRNPTFESARFDVVSVVFDGRARIVHIPDAFS